MSDILNALNNKLIVGGIFMISNKPSVV
jgi:hypothetical protein